MGFIGLGNGGSAGREGEPRGAVSLGAELGEQGGQLGDLGRMGGGDVVPLAQVRLQVVELDLGRVVGGITVPRSPGRRGR